MPVVSCTRVPEGVPAGGKYVCFTTDYRTFVSSKFFRTRAEPPEPPARVCRLPDVFTEMRSPEAFAAGVGVPCRITTPCVIYGRGPGGEEVVVPDVSEELCNECLEEFPPPEDRACLPAWDVEAFLMDGLKRAPFGRNVYLQAAFIGKSRAYVAPWGPPRTVFLALKILEEMGAKEGWELEIMRKHNAFEVLDVVGMERYGRVRDIGFNFYRIRGRDAYEAVLMYWVGSDRSARKYALKLWDLYRDVTLEVLKLAKEVAGGVRLLLDLHASGVSEGAGGWARGGIPLGEVPDVVIRKILSARGVEVEDFRDVLGALLGYLFGLVGPGGGGGEEQAE